MVWDNLKQFGLNLGKSKVWLDDNYQVKWVDSWSVGGMKNYGMMHLQVPGRMKPLGKWGTVGVGINYSYLFGKDQLGNKISKMASLGYNLIYANSFKISDRIMYSPAIVMAQNPLSYTEQFEGIDSFGSVSKDFIGILQIPSIYN